MIAEVPYGQPCPNNKFIKKTNYEICSSCVYRKYLGKTFATCIVKEKDNDTGR